MSITIAVTSEERTSFIPSQPDEGLSLENTRVQQAAAPALDNARETLFRQISHAQVFSTEIVLNRIADVFGNPLFSGIGSLLVLAIVFVACGTPTPLFALIPGLILALLILSLPIYLSITRYLEQKKIDKETCASCDQTELEALKSGKNLKLEISIKGTLSSFVELTYEQLVKKHASQREAIALMVQSTILDFPGDRGLSELVAGFVM
ncbi:MAG TPA: hypothetical protein VGM34_01255 [Chlamydiales bacterium]|jgi:hypothetical protein